MEVIGIITTIVIGIVVASLIRGWVFAVLWGWFVIPIFRLPVLTIPYAIGIGMLVTFLTHQADPDVKTQDRTPAERMWRSFGLAVFVPLLVLFFAWIVKQFI